MPSCILPAPWKLAACHFAAGPAQLLYVSHFAFEPAPYIGGCVAQPAALLNAASYFSSGDLTVGPCQRALCEPSEVGQYVSAHATAALPTASGYLSFHVGVVSLPCLGSAESLYSRCD